MKIKTKKTISHEEARQMAQCLKGFDEGYKKQNEIIGLGASFRRMREKLLKLNQTQAAELAGITQSELSRLESGIGTQGPSYLTISHIFRVYRKYLSERRGGKLRWHISFDSPDQHDDFELIENNTIEAKLNDA